MPSSHAEALSDRPEIESVTAAERDRKRIAAFGERYGVQALYTDAMEMLRQEKPDIIAIATNTKGRADLTCYAVACGAKGIVTEKPMAYTLEEADRMVKACTDASVPPCCGAISTSHPSFGTAKDLVKNGAIGEVLSIEAASNKNLSQHQNWSYFVDSSPAWVIGWGDLPKRESGSNEFRGQGMMVTDTGLVVHFRKGAPAVRITGTESELFHPGHYSDWPLFQNVDMPAGRHRIEMLWPGAKMQVGGGSIYGLADVMDCLAGKLDEPKNSGGRVAVALEVEIAIKLSSAQGGERIDLPLEDCSLGVEYDWHR